MSGARRAIRGTQSGSVLVPVVAIMLVLLICGVPLAEAFGSQRMRSVVKIESCQAAWTAEAGVWHANSLQKEISKPVPFAGGSYTVEQSDDYYYSQSEWNYAVGAHGLTISASSDSGGSSQSPIDESKSASSAKKDGTARIKLTLYSSADSDAVLKSFSLAVVGKSEAVTRFTMDKRTLWTSRSGKSLPTGDLSLNSGSSRYRTIAAGKSEKVELQFAKRQTGNDKFTLKLNFEDGSTSTLTFSIKWSGKSGGDDDD